MSIWERKVDGGVSMKRPGVEAPAQQKSMSGGEALFHSVTFFIIADPEEGSVRS